MCDVKGAMDCHLHLSRPSSNLIFIFAAFVSLTLKKPKQTGFRKQ